MTLAPSRDSDPIVQVLCGCGWGNLAMRESKVPCECPVCGTTLRAAESDEEPSDDWYAENLGSP